MSIHECDKEKALKPGEKEWRKRGREDIAFINFASMNQIVMSPINSIFELLFYKDHTLSLRAQPT